MAMVIVVLRFLMICTLDLQLMVAINVTIVDVVVINVLNSVIGFVTRLRCLYCCNVDLNNIIRPQHKDDRLNIMYLISNINIISEASWRVL